MSEINYRRDCRKHSRRSGKARGFLVKTETQRHGWTGEGTWGRAGMRFLKQHWSRQNRRVMQRLLREIVEDECTELVRAR